MIRIDFDQEYLVDLHCYAIEHSHEDPCMEKLMRILDDKLNRQIDRQFFTASKTAPTEEERYEARRKYLARRSIR